MKLINRLLSAKGRMGRLSYTGYSLFLYLLIIISLFGGLFLFESGDKGLMMVGIVLLPIVAIFISISNIVLMIKRLHDLNMSGYHIVWISLVQFLSGLTQYTQLTGIVVTILAVIISLWLFIAPGTKGYNRFDIKD